jgi:hypothetical protein
MKRRTIARVIAVILLAYATAFLLASTDADDMREYRAMKHEELLAKLAEDHDGSFDKGFGGGLLVVGLAVLLTDGLTVVVVAAIDRISPPETAVTLTRGTYDGTSEGHLG